MRHKHPYGIYGMFEMRLESITDRDDNTKIHAIKKQHRGAI